MKKRIISITLILAMAAASLLACTSKEESKETDVYKRQGLCKADL